MTTMFDNKDFWMLEAAEAIIEGVNAANKGDVKDANRCQQAANNAISKHKAQKGKA